MDDKEIEYLNSCLASGLTVLVRVDVGSQEPGSLTKWVTTYQRVVSISDYDDGQGSGIAEPVAWLEEGGNVALWCCERDEFIICVEIKDKWPAREEVPA